MESYSRGRRGVPAKDVGVERRARVQIPHSPPIPQYVVVFKRFDNYILIILLSRFFVVYNLCTVLNYLLYL